MGGLGTVFLVRRENGALAGLVIVQGPHHHSETLDRYDKLHDIAANGFYTECFTAEMSVQI